MSQGDGTQGHGVDLHDVSPNWWTVVPEIAVAAGTGGLATATVWMGRRVKDEGAATLRLAQGAELDRELTNSAKLIGDESEIAEMARIASKHLAGSQSDQVLASVSVELRNLGRGIAENVAVFVNLQGDSLATTSALTIACFKTPVVPPSSTSFTILYLDLWSKFSKSEEVPELFGANAVDRPQVLIFWRDLLGYLNRAAPDGSLLERWRAPRGEPLKDAPSWTDDARVWQPALKPFGSPTAPTVH